MKKILRQIICILLICCSFGLSGCLGSSSSSGDTSNIAPPSEDLLNTSANAGNIIATKDNVTYYYDSLEALQADVGKDATDRNALKNTFGDAYVFVDPGGETYEINDHYLIADGKAIDSAEAKYPFYKLVGRQVELLADILCAAINRVYLDGNPVGSETNITSSTYTFGNSDDKYYNTIEPDKEKIDALDFLAGERPEDDNEITSFIDLDNIYSYMVFSNLESVDEWSIEIVTGLEEQHIIHQYPFNLEYAVLGGYDILENGTYDDNGTTKYFSRYYNKDDILKAYEDKDNNPFNLDSYLNLDTDYRWEIITTNPLDITTTTISSILGNLKQYLKSYIASALSGIDAQTSVINPLATNYREMLIAIDHLGFTETDKLNIKNQILDNIIGEKAVNIDDGCLKLLKEDDDHFTMSNNKLNILASGVSEYFYSLGEEIDIEDDDGIYNDSVYDALSYKGYRVVIDAMVEQAMNATISIGETETAFPELPRVRIIKMNSWDLMDQPETGEEDEDVDLDNVTPDDIPTTDPETIKFQEKFGEFHKIVGILFTPKQVYGERTMAIKENDEWVKDKDGNVQLKTFTVEGFILTDSDIVLLSEEDKMTTYKVDYQVHTAEKDIRSSSDISEAGYVKPDPMEEATYNSTTTIDIDKQEIIENEETEISQYRMQGYDGFSIISTDSNIQENVQCDAALAKADEENQELVGLKITLKADGSSEIDISTAMYKYLGIYDVNGADGTTFAGYTIDVSNFAGNNYVVANFPILAVNEDEQDRDVKLNILYFFLDCT